MDDNEPLYDPYKEPPKLNDNDALNEILENVKSINKRVGFFYWVSIIGIVILVINLIIYLDQVYDG